MPVKLAVTNLADPSFREEHLYRQERITIGRGRDNVLALPDEQRIVSKAHAEIRVEPEGLQIVDLGSKNFTFVNEGRLASHEPSALSEGDRVRVGEFEIQVVRIEREEAPEPDWGGGDHTVFAVNPFWDEIADLRMVLQQLEAAYRRERPGRRREALAEALAEFSAELPESEVMPAVARALAGEQPDVAGPPSGGGAGKRPAEVEQSAPRRSVSPSEPEPRGTADAVPTYWQQLARKSAEPPPVPEAAPTPPVGEQRGAAGSDEVAGLLLDSVAELLGIPWQFRHEFIGQTIVQSAASDVLYDGDAEALGRFLFDPSLGNEEAARRREMLIGAADALRRHLVAMLDGYRAAVREGVQHFLDEVDLDRIEERLKDEAAWYDRPLVQRNAMEVLRERVGELRTEDWTVTERRIFRPAFIKAYLARMTSLE